MNPYLRKLAFTGPIISPAPQANLGLFVVIPCFNEASLLPVFESLAACTLPKASVEVLAVINSSELAEPTVLSTNQACFTEAQEWIKEREEDGGIRFFVTDVPPLPKKHAGVGLARKIGMDEGLRRFDALEKEGIIVNLDADCTVSTDYLQAIEQHFDCTRTDGASIHFEHPLEGASTDIVSAIVQYELYLRYYIHMQALIGFPFAYQTIGSAMAVRSAVYQAQGGMNKRKAGEDFYFLQKIIELGNFTNMPNGVVYASPRKSDRVPFGTGKAVNDITAGSGEYPVYAPASFEQLGLVFSQVDSFYGMDSAQLKAFIQQLPEAVGAYLSHWNFDERVTEIKRFTTSLAAFRKRFFREFNAFQLMKYLHWMRDAYFTNVTIEQGLAYLLPKLGLASKDSLQDYLLGMRRYDQEQARKSAEHTI